MVKMPKILRHMSDLSLCKDMDPVGLDEDSPRARQQLERQGSGEDQPARQLSSSAEARAGLSGVAQAPQAGLTEVGRATRAGMSGVAQASPAGLTGMAQTTWAGLTEVAAGSHRDDSPHGRNPPVPNMPRREDECFGGVERRARRQRDEPQEDPFHQGVAARADSAGREASASLGEGADQGRLRERGRHGREVRRARERRREQEDNRERDRSRSNTPSRPSQSSRRSQGRSSGTRSQNEDLDIESERRQHGGSRYGAYWGAE